jgi:hypothetical protein
LSSITGLKLSHLVSGISDTIVRRVRNISANVFLFNGHPWESVGGVSALMFWSLLVGCVFQSSHPCPSGPSIRA